MDVWNWLGLAGVMVVLAALPSSSVVLVVTRAATAGVANGIAVAVGIVAGDLLFVGLALAGMSVVAEQLGAVFAVLRYAGGAYLVWTGVQMWRAAARGDEPAANENASDARSRWALGESAAAGLALTLGDVKAILFYASLFPVFVDLRVVSTGEIAGIVAVTLVTVGGVKVVYATAAKRLAARVRDERVRNVGRRVGGTLLIGAGTLVIAKT
ncbi:LysE family translocator [Opitutales bacterium ASA1]|uniref:LysE family translocator n=1 Tax=Congregicoccus parvus TaxID=3081749 RepID=UPI002B29C80F|nr:LysE family translocator [Opitutales bacterium ASA1]